MKTRHVRVIAGELKGRRLVYPAERILRPTMDRTRESLFSSIQDEVVGRGFADLFCAAGAVGIEALSRGASVVHFVEQHPRAIELLHRNLTVCGVNEERWRVHPVDVNRFLEDGGLDDPTIRVVFADPPYGGDEAARLLAHFRSKEYDHIELLILEHGGRVGEEPVGALRFAGVRRFGETHLSLWERRRQN
jgi:16S rRNA (guanine966-N2)-methyltransferase